MVFHLCKVIIFWHFSAWSVIATDFKDFILTKFYRLKFFLKQAGAELGQWSRI